MKIAVVSLYTPEIAPWAKLVAEGKAKYCAQHGYDFICHTAKLEQGKDQPASWSKLPAMYEICQRNQYDWVFWSDADAVVMDYTLPLERLIGYAEMAHLVKTGRTPAMFIGQDDISVVNMGQFALRGNDHGASIMECLWEHGLRRPESRQIPNIDKWWEQAALVDLLDKYQHPGRDIAIVDRNQPYGWNTFKDDAVGNQEVLMIHLAGMPRRDIWASWLLMLAEKRDARRRTVDRPSPAATIPAATAPCGFVPPTPGYAACSRPKGHDGPCAHDLSSITADGEGGSGMTAQIAATEPGPTAADGEAAGSRGVAA